MCVITNTQYQRFIHIQKGLGGSERPLISSSSVSHDCVPKHQHDRSHDSVYCAFIDSFLLFYCVSSDELSYDGGEKHQLDIFAPNSQEVLVLFSWTHRTQTLLYSQTFQFCAQVNVTPLTIVRWIFLPGTAVKNLTASLCPWKHSWACAMEQKGTKVPAVTLSLLSSP